MNKSVLDSVTTLFRPQLPLWACEFTPTHFVCAGVDSKRSRIVGRAALAFGASDFRGSLSERNFNNAGAALDIVRDAAAEAALKGSEVAVVIPDDAARISLLVAESLPRGREEQEAFIRWKLKKTMPFDVDAAQVDYTILGPHAGEEKAEGSDLLVALSPRAVIEEYVELMDKVGLHAGIVLPSSLAAASLVQGLDAGDLLFVKIAPGCISTIVFQNNRLHFYRRVSPMTIFDAVYPTILYYQDKLRGSGIARIVICASDQDVRAAATELQQKLNAPVFQLEPRNVDDLFKPALGALNFIWTNSV